MCLLGATRIREKLLLAYIANEKKNSNKFKLIIARVRVLLPACNHLLFLWTRGRCTQARKKAISESPFASFSNRVLVQNHSNENEFDLHENGFAVETD